MDGRRRAARDGRSRVPTSPVEYARGPPTFLLGGATAVRRQASRTLPGQGGHMERFPVGVGALAALWAMGTLASAQAQEATPGSQWLTYNNRLDGVRFSPLKQITAANASQLGEVCR